MTIPKGAMVRNEPLPSLPFIHGERIGIPQPDNLPMKDTFKSRAGGNFGYLHASSPLLPETIDLATIGLAFVRPSNAIKSVQVVNSQPDPLIKVDLDENYVPESEYDEDDPFNERQPDISSVDTRTNEDIRKALLDEVVNSLDLPDEEIAIAKAKLEFCVADLRQFILSEVVPIVLSVEPAMTSVKQMVPKMFENSGGDIEVDLPTDQLKGYAYTLGLLATRLKLMDLLNLSDEVKERLVSRLIPSDVKEAK